MAAEVLSLINGKTLPKLAVAPKVSSTTNNDGGTVVSHPSNPLPGMMGGEPQPA